MAAMAPGASTVTAYRNLSAECLGCGYSLRGISTANCPECGRTFDPGDPRTYGPRSARRALLLPAIVVGLAAGVVSTITLAVTGVNSGGFIVLTALFAMGFGTLWAAMQKPGWKRSPLSLGIVASAAFIVGAVLPVAVLIGLVIAMGIRC